MKLAIYDLDGTVIDSSHRYRTDETGENIDLQFWIENSTPDMIAKDSLLPHSKQMFKDLACLDTVVIVATARTMELNDANFDYIIENLGVPNYIIHRKEGDTRKGQDMKTAKIMKNLKDVSNFESITIYEDNQTYLQGMTEFFENHNKSVYPIFVKSNQGH